MDIVLGTANPHKVEELRAILGPVVGSSLESRLGSGPTARRILDLAEACAELGIDLPEEPDEPGATFEANAEIKAVAYATILRRPCLADDSGLAVDALGGAPGVHSAHYAGREGTRAERDARNNARLLSELAAVPPERRGARFVCAMCLADEAGRVLHRTIGHFEGFIAAAPRGEHGFGYDPLLWIPELERTSAELAPAEKNARSHRGQAARRMAEWLESSGFGALDRR